MNVTEKVQEILEASAAVTALVPKARIKVPGAWQNLTRPYIVHFPATIDPEYAHDGMIRLRSWLYQVGVYAHTYSSGEDLAHVIVAALSGVHVDSPATEGVHIFLEPGSWYVGSTSSKADGSGPPIEEFDLGFRIFEALV